MLSQALSVRPPSPVTGPPTETMNKFVHCWVLNPPSTQQNPPLPTTQHSFSASLQSEVQGTTSATPRQYHMLNAIGNTGRRVSNMLTAILGPVLFQVSMWLPFVAFGAATLAWTAALTLGFHVRAKQVSAAALAAPAAPSGGGGGGPRGLRLYRQVTFITAELAMAMKNGGGGGAGGGGDLALHKRQTDASGAAAGRKVSSTVGVCTAV